MRRARSVVLPEPEKISESLLLLRSAHTVCAAKMPPVPAANLPVDVGEHLRQIRKHMGRSVMKSMYLAFPIDHVDVFHINQ